MTQGSEFRIPSLDGLRAISVGLVILGHSTIVPATANMSPFIGRLLGICGPLGVRVFFVISGFLITGLLLRELEQNKRINLKKFYYRRTLRIFPPHYCYLLIVFCLAWGGMIVMPSGAVWPALLYISNYWPTGSWYTGHTWSLAVEEQFYLLWPLALVWLGVRRAQKVAWALVLVVPLLRLTSLVLLRKVSLEHFEMTADALALGCLLAVLTPVLKQNPTYLRFRASAYFVCVPLVTLGTHALLANSIRYYFLAHILVGISITNIGIALCIDWCIAYSKGWVGTFLNTTLLSWLGRLSYSLYLWQQLFWSPQTTWGLPALLLGTFGAAIFSYYIIEKPALAWRQKWEAAFFSKTSAALCLPESSIKPTLAK